MAVFQPFIDRLKSIIEPTNITIGEMIECFFDGGSWEYSEGQDRYVCVFNNRYEEVEPPQTDENDNENPSETDEDREDTDDDTVQPDPPPIPIPPLPPIRNPDPNNNPDRKPIPIPVGDIINILPKIPRRRLPQRQREVDEDALVIFQDPVVEVRNDAFTRTYGCLLHNPITSSPIVIRRCKAPETVQNNNTVEDAKKFFEYLIRKTAETGVEEGLVAGCVLTLNLLPTRIIRYAPQGQLAFVFGCNLLTNIATDFISSSSNAHQSIDGNAHINVKYVNCNPQGEEVPDLTKGLDAKFTDINDNECFVPIRNFKENEPEQLGMKRQLQVVYEKTIEEENDEGETVTRRLQKQITLPSPLPLESNDITTPTLDEDAIKDAFPETLNFGKVKVEMSIIPYGYIRFYSTEDDVDDGFTDDFFDDLLELIDGEEKPNSRRYSKRNRSIITGEFERKKAYLFEWREGDGKPPLCKAFPISDDD
jgi:hypothetical protein